MFTNEVRARAVFASSLLGLCCTAQAQSIFTLAGGGTDDGRPATVAALTYANCITLDRQGNLHIADLERHRIRRVDARSGVITTVAGNGSELFAGDGGPAAEASFDGPQGIVFDREGNLLIADSYNNRVRKVSAATGIITTIAGSGGFGFSGDGGPATAARLHRPARVALDASENLYITDSRNNRIRRVDAGTGLITTVAGNGEQGFSGDGGPATAASLNLNGNNSVGSPPAVIVDPAGSLYIADTFNNRVRKVTAGTITTIAGIGAAGFAGDGGAATTAGLNQPSGLAWDPDGDLLIADSKNNRIRKVTIASGVIATVAGGGSPADRLGDGGPASAANLIFPTDIAVDGSASLYIADVFHHRIRRVRLGLITTVAGNGDRRFTGDEGLATGAAVSGPGGLALYGENLYVAEYFGDRVRKVALSTGIITTAAGTGVVGPWGDGVPAKSAQLNAPRGLAVDAAGNLYVADSLNHRIRVVTAATQLITTVAGSGARGFGGDGGPATLASMNAPLGVAVDASGNLYIADTFFNHRIRRVDAATGIIRTVAGNGTAGYSGDGGPATEASLNEPESVAVDSSGDLYIADTRNHRVRKVSLATGMIATVAGNGDLGSSGDGAPATAARVGFPSAVALDPSGNLMIADSFRIRKVLGTGNIGTVAGSGRDDFSGDGGPATAAGLNDPASIAVDPSGSLYIAEASSGRVRAVYPCVTVHPPGLASPADGSTGVSASPRLSWNAVQGAFRYDVLLDTVSPPKLVIAADIAVTTYSPANLQPLTRYSWQVVAKGDPFCTPFSQNASNVRSFTTAATCTGPGAFEVGLGPSRAVQKGTNAGAEARSGTKPNPKFRGE